MTHLEGVLKLDPEDKKKWLAKAGAEGWADMKSVELQKCIDHLKKQISQPAKGGK